MTPTVQGQPKMVTVTVRGNIDGQPLIKITTRNHQFAVSNEINPIGSQEKGVSPLEYLMGAFASSELALFKQVASELGFEYDLVEMRIEGELDPRGMHGELGVRSLLQEIRQTVRVRTQETAERLVKVKKEVEQRCPVFNLFKAANLMPHTVWEKNNS